MSPTLNSFAPRVLLPDAAPRFLENGRLVDPSFALDRAALVKETSKLVSTKPRDVLERVRARLHRTTDWERAWIGQELADFKRHKPMHDARVAGAVKGVANAIGVARPDDGFHIYMPDYEDEHRRACAYMITGRKGLAPGTRVASWTIPERDQRELMPPLDVESLFAGSQAVPEDLPRVISAAFYGVAGLIDVLRLQLAKTVDMETCDESARERATLAAVSISHVQQFDIVLSSLSNAMGTTNLARLLGQPVPSEIVWSPRPGVPEYRAPGALGALLFEAARKADEEPGDTPLPGKRALDARRQALAEDIAEMSKTTSIVSSPGNEGITSELAKLPQVLRVGMTDEDARMPSDQNADGPKDVFAQSYSIPLGPTRRRGAGTSFGIPQTVLAVAQAGTAHRGGPPAELHDIVATATRPFSATSGGPGVLDHVRVAREAKERAAARNAR